MFETTFFKALSIGFSEGAKYIPFVLAAAVLFRLTHFPDIGIEGIFAFGACSMALSLRLGLPTWTGFTLSIFGGVLGGLLTGTLFVKFKLNALICGIITAFVAYSLCFCLLGFRSVGETTILFNESFVAIFGLISAMILCVFFSTRYGLIYRLAGESPNFLTQMGISPNKKILFMLCLGNCLTGIAGALLVSVTGSVNIRIGDFRLFQAIISLVVGEGLLATMIALYKRIYKDRSEASRIFIFPFRRTMQIIFSGTGAAYPLLAAILGSFCYWFIYLICTTYFSANEWTRLVLGLATAILLIIGIQVSKRYHRISPWKFHGYIE